MGSSNTIDLSNYVRYGNNDGRWKTEDDIISKLTPLWDDQDQDEKDTCLLEAIQKRYIPKAVEFMLQRGANPNRDYPHGYLDGRASIFAKLLLETSSTTYEGKSGACSQSYPNTNMKYVHLFLQYGAQPNCAALPYLVRKACEEPLVTLLDAGADVNYKDKNDVTLLMHLVAETLPEYTMKIANILLEHNADVHVKDAEGKTALMHAVGLWSAEGSIEYMQMLLQNNVDVNEKDNDGMTALMHAAEKNRPDIIQFLLSVEGIDRKAFDEHVMNSVAYDVVRAARETKKDFDSLSSVRIAKAAGIELSLSSDFENMSRLITPEGRIDYFANAAHKEVRESIQLTAGNLKKELGLV